MTRSRIGRGARWLAGLWADLGLVIHEAPIQHIGRDWRSRRRARRQLDELMEAWLALPPEEQIGYIHPASPTKPPGWTLETYVATQREARRRRDGAH